MPGPGGAVKGGIPAGRRDGRRSKSRGEPLEASESVEEMETASESESESDSSSESEVIEDSASLVELELVDEESDV